MDELGLLDEFLQRPHQRAASVIGGWFGDEHVQLGDFRGLPARYAFIAMMPQWEFLDFLADEAQELPTFTLRMRADVTGLIEEGGPRRRRARRRRPTATFEIRADLTVGCDGRHSTVRAARRARRRGPRRADRRALVSRRARPAELDDSLARIAPGPHRRHDRPRRLLAMRVRDPEGRRRRAARAPASRIPRRRSSRPRRCSPRTSPSVRSWDDVKLLPSRSIACAQWSRPGLLCIGDAAHAMSPVGGVGINLAIQDAVADGQPARRRSCATAPSTTSDLDARARAPALADQGDPGAAGRHPEQRPRAGAERRQRRARGAAADAHRRPPCRCCSACSRACSAWACAPSTCTRRRP